MIRIYLSEILTPAGYIWEQFQWLVPQKTIQCKYMGMKKVTLKAIMSGPKIFTHKHLQNVTVFDLFF